MIPRALSMRLKRLRRGMRRWWLDYYQYMREDFRENET